MKKSTRSGYMYMSLHDQFVDQTNIVLPRMHGIRETDLIIKN